MKIVKTRVPTRLRDAQVGEILLLALHKEFKILIGYKSLVVRRRGVVGRVPAIQTGGPAGSEILISILGLGACPCSVRSCLWR